MSALQTLREASHLLPRSMLMRRVMLFILISPLVVVALGHVTLVNQEENTRRLMARQQADLLTDILSEYLVEHQGSVVSSDIQYVLQGFLGSQSDYKVAVYNPEGRVLFTREKHSTLMGNHSRQVVWSSSLQPSEYFNNNEMTSWRPLGYGYWLYLRQQAPVAGDIGGFGIIGWLFPLVVLLFTLLPFYWVKRLFNQLEQLVSYTRTLDQQTHYQALPKIQYYPDLLPVYHAINRVSYRFHQKNQTLITHRQFSHQMIDLSSETLFRVEHHGRLNFINSAFESASGMLREQVLGRAPAQIFSTVDPDQQGLLTRLMSSPQRLRLLVRITGQAKVFDLVLTPYQSEQRLLAGYTGILHDVTHYQLELGDLRKQIRESKQQIAENDKMMATMSHELRTPLNGILGMAQLLGQTELNQEQQEYVRTLQNSGEAMLRLINDILDLSKLEAGKMLTERMNFDVLELTGEVCDLMAANAVQKKIELVQFISPDCPRYLSGDPFRIRQILLNLVSNAIKFTQQGFVAVQIRPVSYSEVSERIGVHHTAVESAQWFAFEVRDTGMGISAEQQKELFQFFAQADNTVSRKFGGTGLGLAISRGLAEAMHGGVSLCSQLGEGTTFSLYLPLLVQSETRVYSHPIRLDQTQVALFEPLLINQQGIGALLAALEVKVDVYESLSQLSFAAAHFYGKSRPILLIDFQLLNGKPLSEYLVQFPDLKNSHCILMSAQPVRSIATRLTADFQGFLIKPIRFEHLMAELVRASEQLDRGEDMILPLGAEGEQQKMDAFFEQVKQQESTQPPEQILTVLLAEDNLVNQKVAGKMLQKMNCQVLIAANGQIALDMLREHPEVDLILMDCRMPEMDGLEATRRIRSDLNSIPIVALTANDTEEDREACMVAGMDDFLAKPLDQSKLRQLIARFQLLKK